MATHSNDCERAEASDSHPRSGSIVARTGNEPQTVSGRQELEDAILQPVAYLQSGVGRSRARGFMSGDTGWLQWWTMATTAGESIRKELSFQRTVLDRWRWPGSWRDSLHDRY